MSENFIFTPKTINKQTEDRFFCSLNNSSFVDKDNNPRCDNELDKNILAKIKYRSNNQPRYMIRIDSNRKLFNPALPLDDNKNQILVDNNNENIKFKEVNQKVFDLYLNFLRTTNVAWLNNAERESN